MAKLTKSDACEAAAKMARADAAVQALTTEESFKMEWHERERFARQTPSYALLKSIDTQDRYYQDVEQAYVTAACKVWSGKAQELRNKREAWKRATSGITVKQAEAKVRDLLKSMNIRGMRGLDREGYFGSFEVERSWGAGATLYVRFEHDYDQNVTNPDDANQRAGEYHVKVEVRWSSTTRSLSESELALKVYRELLDAAHEVQAVMDRERVMWTYGVPEEKTEEIAQA